MEVGVFSTPSFLDVICWVLLNCPLLIQEEYVLNLSVSACRWFFCELSFYFTHTVYRILTISYYVLPEDTPRMFYVKLLSHL